MTKEAEPAVADPHLPRPQTCLGRGAGGCRGLQEQELKLKQLSFLQTSFLYPFLLLVTVLFLRPEELTLSRLCRSSERAGGGGCTGREDLTGQ